MYEGNQASMQMVKMLLAGDEMEYQVYECEIVTCKEEKIYMLLKNAELVELSLDALYECNIMEENERYMCRGRVKERYVNQQGKNYVFEITNGFFRDYSTTS